MPSLNIEEVRVIISKFPEYSFPIFVESGTFIGQTIFALESLFKQLHTIELSENLYNRAKTSYKGDKISFHNGESHTVFDTLLPRFEENTKEGVVFFLDGHWSCADTACGTKEVPLLEELVKINELYTGPAIIIIDDYRLFDGKDPVVKGWKEVTKDKVLNTFGKRINNYYFINSYLAEKDRMILNLNAKQVELAPESVSHVDTPTIYFAGRQHHLFGNASFWINHIKEKYPEYDVEWIKLDEFRVPTEKITSNIKVMFFLFEGFDPNSRIDIGRELVNILAKIFARVGKIATLWIISPGITNGQIIEYSKSLIASGINNFKMFNSAIETEWTDPFV